ncbi:MAG: response regulator [Sphingomonas sp.]|uniref:response regulator n=1 Tax=Sphingomonas sp. TaxID=28214 RepID=UPI0022740FBF|nr:response regulator [Sphingomonas sp.]MCX8477652.1 response regulator [Sphingomonas sp.]
MPPEIAPLGLRVLLVEDDEGVRRSLQLLLEWNGFEVRAHALGASVMALKGEMLASIHLLVSDYFLEDGDGIVLLQSLRAAGWQGRAVLITAEPGPMLIDRARAAGFHAVLEKPLAKHALIKALTE